MLLTGSAQSQRLHCTQCSQLSPHNQWALVGRLQGNYELFCGCGSTEIYRILLRGFPDGECEQVIFVVRDQRN